MAATDQSLAAQYDPHAIEEDLYARWENSGAFASTPQADAAGYCIMLPPPNVTGSLHMGHAFQHTVMDALIRHQRMLGRDVLWQAGTDHAGVGTHIVVTRALRGAGIDPKQLSREQFMARVRKWKESSATQIGQQMRRLGDSCDWSRECFTLDPHLSEAVTKLFVRLYEDGLIYRGKRMVNWDPKLLTALADLEVVSSEEDGKLYHVRYPFADGGAGEGMVIATTRPETILVDGALAVAPGDARYAQFLGRRVQVPCTERTIEIIADEHVDPQFGTGCVKITPAHDFNDYEVAQRHPDKDIPIIELMTPSAHLNDNAPPQFRGLERYAAREKIVAELDAQGLLHKVEAHRYMLPRGERSKMVVEPMLSDQWYVKAAPLAAKALDAVRSGQLQFVPPRWQNVYEHWLTGIKDWCISRQIDWGHRIPAWQDADGKMYVAATAAQAQTQAGPGRELRQVDDVLDTWFSSALWPLSTLGWPDRDSAYLRHYFPTAVLVTGNDIIFFWVARMVMIAMHLVGEVPFRKVYMHGLVRDQHGQKMSKSQGNVLDPIDLIDGISLEDLLTKRASPDLSETQAKQIVRRTRKEFPAGIPAHGTDALRLTFASLASHGPSINFDLGRMAGHRRLCTKLWQAARFVSGACTTGPLADEHSAGGYPERWIVSRLQRCAAAVADHYAAFRLDLMVEELTLLLRDEFCDWYIETAKETLAAGDAPAAATRRTLAHVLAGILRLAHPLIPFVTAKLWEHIGPLAKQSAKDIIRAPYPLCEARYIDKEAEAVMEEFTAVVHAVRSLRTSLGVEPGRRLDGALETNNAALANMRGELARLARLGCIELQNPLANLGGEPVVDVAGSRLQLVLGAAGRGWQDKLTGQVASSEAVCKQLEGKLAAREFTERAPPQVVAEYRARLERARQQLNALELLVRANLG